eukprot:Clim_evm13s218 gene=Clim_evmTU13s218
MAGFFSGIQQLADAVTEAITGDPKEYRDVRDARNSTVHHEEDPFDLGEWKPREFDLRYLGCEYDMNHEVIPEKARSIIGRLSTGGLNSRRQRCIFKVTDGDIVVSNFASDETIEHVDLRSIVGAYYSKRMGNYFALCVKAQNLSRGGQNVHVFASDDLHAKAINTYLATTFKRARVGRYSREAMLRAGDEIGNWNSSGRNQPARFDNNEQNRRSDAPAEQPTQRGTDKGDAWPGDNTWPTQSNGDAQQQQKRVEDAFLDDNTNAFKRSPGNQMRFKGSPADQAPQQNGNLIDL